MWTGDWPALSFPRPTLRPSLISHTATVDVKHRERADNRWVPQSREVDAGDGRTPVCFSQCWEVNLPQHRLFDAIITAWKLEETLLRVSSLIAAAFFFYMCLCFFYSSDSLSLVCLSVYLSVCLSVCLSLFLFLLLLLLLFFFFFFVELLWYLCVCRKFLASLVFVLRNNCK